MSNIGAVVGGSSADVGNGIFFNSDLITAAQNVGVNGAVIKADTGVTYDHAGGTPDRKFSKAGIGTGSIVGMYALVTGTNITSGYYEITSIAGDDSWVACADITATDDNADSTLDIGGACPIVGGGATVGNYALQEVLDDALSSAAAANVDIFITGTGTLTATIDFDTGGGTATTSKSVIGVNTSYIDDGTRAIITTASALANGLFNYTAIDFVTIKNIDLNGSNDGSAGEANYCIYTNAADTSNSNRVINCLLHNADLDGANIGGSTLTLNGFAFIDCEVYDNGKGGAGGGLVGRSSGRGPMLVTGCSIHDNPGPGIFTGGLSILNNNEAYDNTGNGIDCEASSDGSILAGNTSFNNGGAGIRLDAAALNVTVYNNCSVGNTGVGYDFDGVKSTYVFAYNLSAANSAHYSEGADGTFAAFVDGNNQASSQTADQIFVTVTDGSEDLTPETGSDLINNGLDPQSTPTIDLGAIQLDAAGGSPSGVRNPLQGPIG